MELVICGDLCPTDLNRSAFENGNHDYLFGDVVSVIRDAQISIANLECPLTDSSEPVFKSGPNLRSSSASITAIASAGFNALSIANNHIMDYGTRGLEDTIRACKSKGIPVTGAGKDCTDAAEPLCFEEEGLKICILSFADDEGNIASDLFAGASGFRSPESFDHIAKVKTSCDRVIVLFHSGLEHYRYPSPRLQRVCRAMVRAGANLVVCQHSHCIGCKEEYSSGTIVYGQGNFLFAKSSRRNGSAWNTGLILRLSIDNNSISVSYVPVLSHDGKVELAKGNDRIDIMKGFLDRSEKIKSLGFIEESFEELAQDSMARYTSIMLALPRLLYIINKLFRNTITRLLLSRKRAVVSLNIVRCESHREILVAVLEKYSSGAKPSRSDGESQ